MTPWLVCSLIMIGIPVMEAVSRWLGEQPSSVENLGEAQARRNSQKAVFMW